MTIKWLALSWEICSAKEMSVLQMLKTFLPLRLLFLLIALKANSGKSNAVRSPNHLLSLLGTWENYFSHPLASRRSRRD